jgi:uncharacterized protein DUF6192
MVGIHQIVVHGRYGCPVAHLLGNGTEVVKEAGLRKATPERRLAQARDLFEGANRKEQSAEGDRWEAARIIHELVVVDKVAPKTIAEALSPNQRTGKPYGTEHVRLLRRTWEQYGDNRNPDWKFWDHYSSFKRPNIDPRDRYAPRPAGEILSADDSTLESLPVERQAAIGRRIMSNPLVARSVLRDKSTRDKVSDAHIEVVKEQTSDHMERTSNREAEVQRQLAPIRAIRRGLDVDVLFEDAARALQEALNLLRETELTEEDREGHLDEARKVKTILGWVESFLIKGDESWDEALAKLMNEGR